MSRVLVSGGNGFVGSYVCRSLLDQGVVVDVIDVSRFYLDAADKSFKRNQEFKLGLRDGVTNYFDINILDTASVLHLLNKYSYSAIIHLAATPLATDAMKRPSDAFNEIVVGTHSLLEAVRLSDIRERCKLVCTSSSMAYGDFIDDIAVECHPCDPKDMYGSFKYVTEIISKAYVKNFSMDVSLVRPSAVYGPGDNNRRVVQSMLSNAIEGKPVTVVDADEIKLDFTFVADVANAIAELSQVKTTPGQIYNVTHGNSRSLRELVNIIKELIPSVEVLEKTNTETFRPKRGTLSNDKIRSVVKADFPTNLETGVNMYLDYMRGNA